MYTHTRTHIHHIFLIDLSETDDGPIGCFHVLAAVNSAAMNTAVHISFQIMVFSGYMHGSGIAGSRGNSLFSFLRNFHSGCTSLHSYQRKGALLREGIHMSVLSREKHLVKQVSVMQAS